MILRVGPVNMHAARVEKLGTTKFIQTPPKRCIEKLSHVIHMFFLCGEIRLQEFLASQALQSHIRSL